MEYKQINNKQDLIISLIKEKYNVISGPKLKPSFKWDMTNINKKKYKEIQKDELNKANEIGVSNDMYKSCAVRKLKDSTSAVNKALKEATQLISSQPTRRKLSSKWWEFKLS